MDSLLVLLILGVLAFVIFMIAWTYTRSETLLNRWAQRNDYEILDKEQRFLRRGPLFWTTSRGQVVYYVEVRDRQGRRRRGWVRCGSWWWGLFQDKVEVRWDE